VNPKSIACNEALIGRPGSRWRIDTPALVLDLEVLEQNLATMAALARERGIGLRPHAKTHKSVEIGRRQLEAGAVGLCCAKLGEAEVLAKAGLDHLLLTAPVIAEPKIVRLLELNATLSDLRVVVDDANNASMLADAAAGAGQTLSVLIVVDVGSHRFGVVRPEDAVAIARLIADRPSLRLRGIQGYAGYVQHMPDYRERRRASYEALGVLGKVRDALAEAGFACEIVTGSGTGTHDFDHEPGLMTDLQVGSYIFMDVDYDRIEQTEDGSRRFDNALFVHTSVVSANHPGFVTTDAGSKSFSMDGPAPRIFSGAPDGSVYGRFGDEFGRVDLPSPEARLARGDLIVCVVPHCDPTLNLHDHYHGVRGDTLVALWPIDARGCAG
jgi:3-hydroxy-D-aspartate aldolase